MKNKIKQLFEDYLYSDHVHNGLFKEPKDDIIKMLKGYNDKRNDAINKIVNFVKKIEAIPEQIRKMKANILLASILRKKESRNTIGRKKYNTVKLASFKILDFFEKWKNAYLQLALKK